MKNMKLGMRGNIIISRPWLMSKKRMYGEKTVTVFFWSILAFWLRTTLIIVLWAFGFHLFYSEIAYERIGADSVFFLRYLLGIIVIFSLMQLWNRYNYLHFHGKERRRAVRDVEDSEMAGFYSISEEEMKQIIKARRLDVGFESGGNITFGADGERISALVNPENLNGR